MAKRQNPATLWQKSQNDSTLREEGEEEELFCFGQFPWERVDAAEAFCSPARCYATHQQLFHSSHCTITLPVKNSLPLLRLRPLEMSKPSTGRECPIPHVHDGAGQNQTGARRKV